MGISKEEIAELKELKVKAESLVKEYREYKLNNNDGDRTQARLNRRLIEIGRAANRIKYLEGLKNEGE